MRHSSAEAVVKLPEQLPSDPEELERLYQEYAREVEDFDDAELQRIMDARLAVWGIDPHQMTADQIFGAMSESMNSMLVNLYSAKGEAPDDEAVRQVDEIIKMAEELREQIAVAMHGADVKNEAKDNDGNVE
jgi:DNA-directed RNA polymerase subunit F